MALTPREIQLLRDENESLKDQLQHKGDESTRLAKENNDLRAKLSELVGAIDLLSSIVNELGNKANDFRQ